MTNDVYYELTLAAAFSAFFLSAASFFNNFFNAFFDKGSPFSSNRTSMYQLVIVTVVDELDMQTKCISVRISYVQKNTIAISAIITSSHIEHTNSYDKTTV